MLLFVELAAGLVSAGDVVVRLRIDGMVVVRPGIDQTSRGC